MDVTIRRFERTDHDDVLRLASRLLLGVDPSRPAALVRTAVEGWVGDSVRSAESDGHAAWVAVLDGSVIGFVSVAEDQHWCGETDAWVGELVVDERFERQGVALSLIATVEGWAVQRGLGHIRLTTGAANHGARAFYERLGYALSEVTLARRLPASTSS